MSKMWGANKQYNDKFKTDIYNTDSHTAVKAQSNKQGDSFTRNLDKYIDLVSYFRWNIDLWYDLITPEEGGIKLDLDQRVFLRGLARFVTLYGVFPRGYGKTLIELMALYHCAIFYPDIDLSMTAQTRENASKLMEEKHREIVKFYPMMKDEITKSSFTKDMAEINFTSGGLIN